MAPLAGRTALVTGGSRGIGRAIAAALTAAGAEVTITGRSEATLREVVAASGDAQRLAVGDVTEPGAMTAALEVAGPVDLLVANAGGAVSRPFGKTRPEDFAAMFQLNVLGVVQAAQAVLPGMVERRFGRIVAVASTAGLKGYPYVTAYCAAKHAVIGLVRALAVETAKTGVTVNAVCPGFTDTDLVAGSLDQIVAATGRDREAALAELTRHNPQGRLVAPAEVADAVLWLCGAGAASVTGQAIAVAGGEVDMEGVATQPAALDAETRATERPEDHREEVRLWLRLLTCTTMIEGEIRRRLRESFGVTLPRFDLMAQLEKAPDGMTLSDVSRRMMVSNGNLTGLVERLVEMGHVERRSSERDRRAQILKLTRLGRSEFAAMARAHEGWIAEMFAGLGPEGIETLMVGLGHAKASVRETADRRRG